MSRTEDFDPQRIDPFELMQITTEAEQAFTIAGFSPPCKAHFRDYMDNLRTAPPTSADISILNEMSRLKEAIFDNPDSRHVVRQSLITEARMFIHIAPSMATKVAMDNLGDLPDPHEWAQSLVERGAFSTVKERENGTL